MSEPAGYRFEHRPDLPMLPGLEWIDGKAHWEGSGKEVDWSALVEAGYVTALYPCPMCGQATVEDDLG